MITTGFGDIVPITLTETLTVRSEYHARCLLLGLPFVRPSNLLMPVNMSK